MHLPENVTLSAKLPTPVSVTDAYLAAILVELRGLRADLATEQVAADVPDGAVDAVTGWVHGDPCRAALARDTEKSKSRPRKTLVAELDKVARGV